MASLQKTYSGDLSTSIARQLWTARNIAAAAKEDAVDVAKAYGVDPMLRRGEFFGHALGFMATSGLPKRFQHQMPSVTMGNPSYLARGQRSNDPLMGTPAHLRNLPEYQNIASPEERKFKSNISKIPGAPTTTNTKTREKGVVVKDQKLGNFLAAVALSLSSSLNSINKKMDEANEGVIVAKDGIDLTYKKLEENSDSLESKLDSIIDALRFANLTEDQKADRRETAAKQREQDMETDMSSANRILMQDMDQEEIRAMQQEDKMDDDRGPITNTSTPTQNAEQLNLDLGGIPEFAEGGIASGPDSGYLAVLHGDEAVIPLDNNYTQGEQTALNNPVTPDTPMLERGTDNIDSMQPKMLPWKGLKRPSASTNNINIGGMGGSELAAAIQLPAKAAGIVTMGLMGNVMKHAKLPPGVVAHMKSISAPIAATFGVSDLMAADLTEQSEEEFAANQRRQDVLAANRGREGRERGILGKIKDFLFGTGGGYRGVGGGGTYRNRTGGGTGGGNIAWGKKKQKEITSKADFGAIKRRTATTDAYMVEAGMLDPSAFENKYGISADRWLRLPDYPTDQSSLDSPVFTKTVSYKNAFDYNNFDSPQYGLRTSEIAYNMSMEDEVKGILNGLSDPDSQLIMNNQTASTDSDNQIEHSAIAVRGNPLKEGTYLSPYSV